MPHGTSDLGALIGDIAERKHRAGQARFGRQAANGENPREVFIGGCSEVAAAFAADGFRFATSGPHFARRAAGLTFRVSFQSSHHNIAGEYVAMWVHANVRSPVLKNWRKQHRSVFPPNDFVAGGQIGNLVEQHSWMEWNLAAPLGRRPEVMAAVETVRDIALPYFAAFTAPAALCDRLLHSDVPGFGIVSAFEYAACFTTLSVARSVAAAFLARRPNLLGEYREALRTPQAHDESDQPRGYVGMLAALSHRHRLGDLSTPAVA